MYNLCYLSSFPKGESHRIAGGGRGGALKKSDRGGRSLKGVRYAHKFFQRHTPHYYFGGFIRRRENRATQGNLTRVGTKKAAPILHRGRRT